MLETGPDNPLPLLDEFFRQQEEREALAEQDRKSIQGGQRAASPGMRAFPRFPNSPFAHSVGCKAYFVVQCV